MAMSLGDRETGLDRNVWLRVIQNPALDNPEFGPLDEDFRIPHAL